MVFVSSIRPNFIYKKTSRVQNEQNGFLFITYVISSFIYDKPVSKYYLIYICKMY